MTNLFKAATGVLCLGTALAAQVTKTEILKPTTPKDDSKPNSADVPEVYAISGDIKRVVVLRFKYGADLLAGLEKMVKEQKIKNGVILSGITAVQISEGEAGRAANHWTKKRRGFRTGSRLVGSAVLDE